MDLHRTYIFYMLSSSNLCFIPSLSIARMAVLAFIFPALRG